MRAHAEASGIPQIDDRVDIPAQARHVEGVECHRTRECMYRSRSMTEVRVETCTGRGGEQGRPGARGVGDECSRVSSGCVQSAVEVGRAQRRKIAGEGGYGSVRMPLGCVLGSA